MKKLFFICMWMIAGLVQAQQEVKQQSDKPVYDRKEEIIYDGKRYRVHNNYLSVGAGFIETSLRVEGQRSVALDYQYHIKRQQFQTGAMISGNDFFGNNYTQVHTSYGFRKENKTSNLAAFIGPTYFTGVEGVVGSPPTFYDGFGGYVVFQAVYKVKYDIGLGVELFGDISYKQRMLGIKFIAFFSGSYRGVKKNYNPNVHSENKK